MSRVKPNSARTHWARLCKWLLRKSGPGLSQKDSGMVRLRRGEANLEEKREHDADLSQLPRPRLSCRSQLGEQKIGCGMASGGKYVKWRTGKQERLQTCEQVNPAGSDPQQRERSKYHQQDGRNADLSIISCEIAWPALRTTPSHARTPVSHEASSQMCPICKGNQESPNPVHAVFWSCTSTRKVGERENCGTSDGSCGNRLRSGHVEACWQGCDLQARKQRLHETQGVLLHFFTKLHCDWCWKSWCRATSGRGWEKRTAKRWPLWKPEKAVSNRQGSHHGQHSTCCLEKGLQRWCTHDRKQGCLPERS